MSATLFGGELGVRAGGPLAGRAAVPGDKSISHRALILAALAEGRSRLAGLSAGSDVAATARALAALGAGVTGEIADVVHLDGGRSRLVEADGPLELANSGTGTRLLAGVAASLSFLSILTGDASLRSRPMGRVVEPLRSMGARIDGRRGASLAPLVVRGGDLSGIDHRPAVASAQVKAAVLLAGLDAAGVTVVREALATRRHTEELLALAGAPPEIEDGAGGYSVAVRRCTLSPFELDVPGDPSQAAFLAVAAAVVPGSDVVVQNCYLGPGRAGFLEVLEQMGAELEVTWRSPTSGDLRVRHSRLSGVTVGGESIPSLIDEIPVLAVAACFAEGVTAFTGAAELRAKESDRILTTASELRRLGIEVDELDDGLVVHGRGEAAGDLGPLEVHASSHGDHRVAMALAVAALARRDGSQVRIAGFDAVSTSWPGFADTLSGLGATLSR